MPKMAGNDVERAVEIHVGQLHGGIQTIAGFEIMLHELAALLLKPGERDESTQLRLIRGSRWWNKATSRHVEVAILIEIACMGGVDAGKRREHVNPPRGSAVLYPAHAVVRL